MDNSHDRIAVLLSGGLDSAVLVADLAKSAIVFPIYVEFGLTWEWAEKKALSSYLDRIAGPHIQPLTLLQMPVRSLYGSHWSTTGEQVPGYDAPVDADYLPGRNVFLIGLAAVWCSLHQVSTIAIGSLLHNPYADATPDFFVDYARLLSGALTHQVEVIAPYRGLQKSDLIREHAGLPLELTLTCVSPPLDPADATAPLHCGACIKCRERRDAFREAGVPDLTRYAVGGGG
jgi:7-cyano-7-deazaguanine synthase